MTKDDIQFMCFLFAVNITIIFIALYLIDRFC